MYGQRVCENKCKSSPCKYEPENGIGPITWVFIFITMIYGCSTNDKVSQIQEKLGIEDAKIIIKEVNDEKPN